MNVIVKSKKYKGMYYINTKPILVDNLGFYKNGGKFKRHETRSLSFFLKNEKDKILLNKIIKIVSGYYGVDILLKTRKKEVCEPRQIAMYLAMQPLNKYNDKMSSVMVANTFGLKQHGTVLHAFKNIFNWIKTDKQLREDILFLTNKIKELRINEKLIVD